MNIEIKYFGMLTEITGCDSEYLEISEEKIKDVIILLYAKYPGLKTKNFQIAQNQQIVSGETKVSGEEIAILPPFSGG